MDLDPLLLSRIQFAFTISWHIIFPAFTIGLAAWLATAGRLPAAPCLNRGSYVGPEAGVQRQGLSPGSNGKAAGLQFSSHVLTAVLEIGPSRAQDGAAPLAPFRH
jgi:Cytochrome bd terminal oxidase subunit I